MFRHMTNHKVTIWARIDEPIKELAEKLASAKGFTLSEYVRQLIIDDLDSRTVFTTMLKEG